MRLSPLHGRAARAAGCGDSAARDPLTASALRDLAAIAMLKGTNAEGDRRLLALMEHFGLEVHLGLTSDTATWIALMVWESPDPSALGQGGAFSGAGFQPAEAVRSCLGEFAEFQSWLYRPGDATRRCHGEALGTAALDPWRTLGFAKAHRRPEHGVAEEWSGFDEAPCSRTFSGEIDWSTLRDLGDGSIHWLPAQACFARYAERAEGSPSAWRNDSNGCAAGVTPAHAENAALLELIERDAAGIWWFGQHRRPAVDPAGAESEALLAGIAARNRAGQRVQLLDLTTDIGVPVVVAILLSTAGTLEAIGFGCHPERSHGIASAYLEMCQMDLSVALVRRRANDAREDASLEDRQLLRWLAQADTRRLPHLMAGDEMAPEHLTPDAGVTPLQLLQAAGLRCFARDLTRSDIGIPAVRAFAPGLCHFKPRLGHTRLIEVPKRLGWRAGGFDIGDLSRFPLLL